MAGDDGYMILPDGQRVTDMNGPVLLEPGKQALVGPDGKVLLNDNGDVVTVPANCSVQRSAAPKIKRPTSIIEEVVAQEKAITGKISHLPLPFNTVIKHLTNCTLPFLTAESMSPQQSVSNEYPSVPRAAPRLRGAYAEVGTPTSPPPLPSTLPPGNK